jgi:hypothetical protein
VFEKQRRYYSAQKFYKDILALDNINESSRVKIKELESTIEAYKQERLSYIKEKLELRDMKVIDPGPQLSVQVFNNGDKIIEMAQGEILYYDAQDNIIKREVWFPSIPDPQSKQGYGFMLKPPEGWARRAELKILDIKFLNEEWR